MDPIVDALYVVLMLSLAVTCQLTAVLPVTGMVSTRVGAVVTVTLFR